MNERLIEFLKKHLERGSDMEEVKQALLSAGHDIKVVEEHINHVLKYRKLKSYIKRHVQIGSDIDKLKQYLANAGYDMGIVEGHINDALKGKKNKRYVLITLAVAISILISVLGFYSFKNIDKKSGLTINESKEEELGYKRNIDNFNKALISNDSLVCESIDNNLLKLECQRKFLLNVSNETTERVSDESFASKELLNKALISHNTSICLEIKDSDIRIQCEQILKR